MSIYNTQLNKIPFPGLKKNNNGIMLLATIFSLLIFTSCSSGPKDKLKSLINKALRTNNNVNKNECEEITSYLISKKDKLKEYFSGEQPDIKKIKTLILEIAAKRRDGLPQPEIACDRDSNNISQRPSFNIYIENSRSMDGYVKGNTSFEAAITRLLVDIDDYVRDKQKLNINLINSKIFPATQVDIRNFASKLEPGSKTFDVGGKGRSVSNLNDVFRMVLDSMRSGISILVSDCIYSLGKDGDTEGSLNIQKSLTMQVFLEHLRKTDLATICLKLVSGFNGSYYNKNNKVYDIKNEQRPYYIWLMGPKAQLEQFYNTLDPQNELTGFQNSYVLFNNTAGETPFYTVLKETNKIGNFKSDRGSREFVHAISDIGYENNTLQFTLAADLGKIPVDSSYLFDKANYQLTEGFTLTDIQTYNRNKVSSRDRVALDNTGVTHLLIIKTSKNFTIQNADVSLMRRVPAWVEQTHSPDDADVQSGSGLTKTFGLKHLVEGVNDAYRQNDPKRQAFITFIITIKK